jgi:hypothetical protein
MAKGKTISEAIGGDGLTDRQRVWIAEYLKCWNATEAARRAGYKDPSQAGYENKIKQEIREIINERLANKAMSADEVLARLSEQATADMGDFLSASGRGIRLDLKRARELGKLHLVRKYNKTNGGTSIELVDAKDALVQLGRHYKLFTDKIEISNWETRIVQAIRSGEVDYGSVVEEFGSALAVELYRKANVEIKTDGGIIPKTE